MTNPSQKDLSVVVGLGVTGLSCVRYLKKQDKKVAVTDSRTDPPGLSELEKEFPDVPVFLGKWDETLLSKATQLIVSPGISLQEPLIAKQIDRGVDLMGDIELFARAVKKPVIAITGSNGKTTVTTLVGEMIKASGYQTAVCGNIGTPVLDWLYRPQPDYYVIELSSFQLETTFSLSPKISVCLNVSPDHMDRYPDYLHYLQAKQRIYLGCQHAIINWDQPDIWNNLKNLKISYSFTSHRPINSSQFGLDKKNNHLFLSYHDQLLISEEEMILKGHHHLLNALAALAIGQSIGLPMNIMLDVLRKFSGLPHRCQLVSTKKGVHWYNDSKGTNVGATIAAIQTIGLRNLNKIFLIAGGEAKNADLSPLKSPVAKYIDHVFLYGKDAKILQNALQEVVSIDLVQDLSEAVKKASEIATSGDAVLLSPACASFDMFKNYEHRGETFVQLIKELS